MSLATWILIVINAVVALTESTTNDFRLPKTVVPFHYKLKILTKLTDDFSYSGKVWIDVEAMSDVQSIVLNSKNLKIYENETKVEELSNTALENVLRANSPTKTMKRSAIVKHGGRKRGKAEELMVTPGLMAMKEPSEIYTEGLKKPETDEIKSDNKMSSIMESSTASTESLLLETAENHATTKMATQTENHETVKMTSEPETVKMTSEPENQMTIKMVSSTEEIKPEISPETELAAMSQKTTSMNQQQQQEHHTTEMPTPEEIKPDLHQYQPNNQIITIHLSKPLTAGRKYRILLRFKGTLSDSLTGFHRVSFSKRNSKKVSWLASTVFEPNDARSAFPCFDEPEFKATFDISLAHDKKYTALSNMPVKSVSSVDGRYDYQWTTFERTPKMSTFLVAFLISDLGHLTATDMDGERNTTYRFWARQDVLQRTRYAAKIVPQMKKHLEDILGVPDVMPKYDFVALPSFISNALENWGLISFAEKNLLYGPGITSAFSKFETTQILGHELAHSWFGNLVTPKYWDQIWLSEGFSNFFEIIATDYVQPSWDVRNVALVFAYLKVFSLDAMHSSHPLVPKIKNLHDVNDIFDSISYQKGFYIIRMLNYTLGEETFMRGVRNYLTTNKFSNVDENNLWDVMTMQGHVDGTLPEEFHLREVMQSWTQRTGYPVVDVIRDYDNQTAVVTQRRFLRPKFDMELRRNLFADEEPGETKWYIPLTYTTGQELNFSDTKPKLWLRPTDTKTVLMDMPDEQQFLLVNLEASGLYRVNYDEKNWELLIDLLLSEHHEDIPVVNRVQIIDDLLDFARAGEISYLTAFDAASYLKKERHFLPWKAALSNFEYISRMFRSTSGNRLFKKFIRSLVGPKFDELGIEPRKNENILDAMNRRQIVKWACATGHRPCTRKSLSLYRKWTQERKPDENNPIPSNIRSVVYCAATAHGGPKDWQFLWSRYLNNADASDKAAIINGLGCTKSTKTLRRYLDWSLSESSGIRKQDSISVFKSVARNEVGFAIAKDFMKKRIGDVRKHLGGNPMYVSQMVESIASKMNRESHLQELEVMEEQHFSKTPAPRSFKQAKERVTFNIDWLEQNYDQITDWLKKQRF